MKKVILSILCTFFICSLCSCSYVETEKKLKQTIEDKNDSNNEQYLKEDNYTPATASEEQIHKLGEKVTSTVGYDDDSESMDFTINDAELFNSLKSAGVELDDTIITDSDLEIYNPREDKFVDGWKLLVADVTITNIDCEVQDDENNIGWLGIASEIDLSDYISDIMWFSDHVDDLNENKTNYYHYILPVGETKTVKMGWFINSDKVDLSELNICIGVSTNDEFKEYVSLSKEE